MDIPIGNWQAAIENILGDVTKDHDDFITFSSLKTNRERIDFIIKNKLLRSVDWLPVYFDGCNKGHDKSEGVAEVWKNKGNKCFKQRRYLDALSAYTQACITAPSKKGNILALSYGNRSAALFHLSHFEACLLDIERALQHAFPASSRHKILLRKINALCILKKKIKATEDAEALKCFIVSKDCKLNGDQRDAVNKELEMLQTKITSLTDDPGNLCQDKDGIDNEGTLINGVNDVMCQASKAVSLVYSASKGRYLEATQDIPQGSTIILEKPFSVVLLPDHYDSYCHHCLSLLPLTPVGCEQCSHVQFCDETCRDDAWFLYHKVECSYLYLLHSIGIAHLSLRTVLLAGTDFISEFVSQPKVHEDNGEEINGINPEGVYDRSYLPVFCLMTHENNTEPQDLLQYSLTAVLLLSILMYSGCLDSKLNKSDTITTQKRTALLCDLFYGTLKKDTVNERELPSSILDIGGVLLHHILQLVCNAHAITCLQSTSTIDTKIPDISDDEQDGPVEDIEQVRIATAIYPTASLMNHSCDPTVVSSFQKDILTVKTIKDVKKGEEIYNCYGPHSRRMSTTERQEILQSQYHFVCKCLACCSQPKAHLRFGTYKCQNCAGIISDSSCTECGVFIPQMEMKANKKKEKELTNLFQAGLQMLKDQRFEAALIQFKRCRKGRKTLLYKDHRDLALCDDSIARCYASLGEFSLSADHLYKSVEFSKLIYGTESVEYGHELQKLSEVLFTAERLAECLDVAQKSYAILRCSYCTGHSSLRQLEGLIMTTTVGLTPATHK